MFRKCALFTECMSIINNTQMDNAKDIDVVMTMYNLIEYNDTYSKTSGILLQYYRDDPNDDIVNSESFKSKIKISGNTPNDGNTRNIEISVPLKYSSNFWRAHEMTLITCEISLILTWYKNCFISSSVGEIKLQ